MTQRSALSALKLKVRLITDVDLYNLFVYECSIWWSKQTKDRLRRVCVIEAELSRRRVRS